MSTIYVHDEKHNRYEGMTKEQIINAIVQAVEQGEITDLDDGFITKIKELNGNQNIQIWIGTTAQFNAIATKAANTLYILTDDDSADSWDTIAEQLNTLSDEYDDIVSGATTVPNAANTANTDFTHSTWTVYDGTAITAGTYEMRYKIEFGTVGAGGYKNIYNFGMVTFEAGWMKINSAVSCDEENGNSYFVTIKSDGTMKVYYYSTNNLPTLPSELPTWEVAGINHVLEYRRIR